MTPPTKPPRGVKHGKETSGLLMSVIRALSASETNEQRECEKAKLEAEYKRSDRKLDELVAKHEEDLTQVMQMFTTVSARVSSDREKIHAVKEKIHACKTLLGCRRDELRKLWFEGQQHKFMLQLLEEIGEMTEIPSQVATFLAKKHYLHATKLLVNAGSLGNGTLDSVEDLRELASELQLKKQQLHVKLLEELKKHLYVRSSQEAFHLRRQGSGRDPALLASPFQREAELRASARRRPDSKAKRALLDINNSSELNRLDKLEKHNEIIENTYGDPEADSSHFMAIIVECLVLLDKLSEALETLKVNMQAELLMIIDRTSKDVLEFNSTQGTSQHNLLELLETVFEQFRFVSKAHETVLQHMRQSIKSHKLDVKLYEMSDFWSKLQAVVQLLLTNYLDIQNISVEQLQPAVFTESGDISSFFSRRKLQSKKKGALFKFEASTHGLNSYLTDAVGSNNVSRSSREKVLVCTPDPNNITLIFLPLMKFISEIEEALGCTSKSPCTLNQFVSDYVAEVYLGRLRLEVAGRVDTAVRNVDAWKAITTPDIMRDLAVSKPLLQSAVTVEKCLREWRDLMGALPPHAARIAQAVIGVLQGYRDTCHAAYRGIVQPHAEDRRICSAAWLKDEDISRFLKTLPNWTNLKTQRQRPLATRKRGVDTTEEESPADVRQRNLREAEILASNLGEGGINSHEIIGDINALKGLAQLQETMEWFSDSVRTFGDQLMCEPTISQPEDGPSDTKSVEHTLKTLSTLAQDFDDLADTCLLVLHLEVRVQCFHYLLNKPGTNTATSGANSNDTSSGVLLQETDPKVQQLGRVLNSMDEAMTASLQPHKCKYIFEGLGHLISKILISSSQYMEKINEPGIESMCRNVFALQQTLTNITMCREVALDHARHYFELFYLSPEEILASVMEKGPEFSELEYMNAFQLINRSQPTKNFGAVNVHLERLSDILGEVGVTV